MYLAKFWPQRILITPIYILCTIIALGSMYVILMRLRIAANTPLWLDETWSAMIATQPSWRAFWREAWLDVNPPLYYIFLRGWTYLFGDSNFMLRIPSMIFVVSSALLPLIWRPSGLTHAGAWTLSSLILLSEPGLDVMRDARGYGLVLLLSTISCLIFAEILARLTLRRITIWVIISTMMFLTHYYSAALILGQTIVLFHRHRIKLLRMWPASLVAIPGLAWFVHHLPRLQDYARPDVSAYPSSGFGRAVNILLYLFGVQYLVPLVMIVAMSAFIIIQHRTEKTQSVAPSLKDTKNLALTACAAAIGFFIAMAVNSLKPSLVPRYLITLAPSAMVALTLMTQRCDRKGFAGALLALAFLLPNLTSTNERVIYDTEKGSNFVRQYNPDRVLFLWDHPLTRIIDQRSLEKLGGYHLKRNGAVMPVQAIILTRADNPNAILREAAKGGRPAVIWLFDSTDRTAAHTYPPTFEHDPMWTCRDRSREIALSGGWGSIACVKL